LRPPLTPAPKVRDRIEAATQAEADHIVPCVNSLLMAWPPTVLAEQEQAPAGAAQALVEQTVATVAVIRPFSWEMLPPELQTLVVIALLGHADQLSCAEEAAQMQGDFAHALRASKGLYETVVPHFNPVFFCALRLAPMGPTQLLGTPLHRLLGPVEPKSPQA